eukprot:scaffold122619_cov24-Phaeocystis_antarctica.AAC.1
MVSDMALEEPVPSCGNIASSRGMSTESTDSSTSTCLGSSLGNLVSSCPSIVLRNLVTSGKSPTGSWCARCTCGGGGGGGGG